METEIAQVVQKLFWPPNKVPKVSVIIPCRNEVNFIGKCLDSLIANDYPKEQVEVLVVDGMSEDRTRAVIESYSQRWRWIKLLDNPKRITPAALNIGIRQARGEVLMRMDAHTIYPTDYIIKCVRVLEEYGANNVGGRWEIRPRTDTILGRSIVQALSHRFGTGNAYYRFDSFDRQPRWVDAVPFFCLKRETLDRIGKFNEMLSRGQDMEFNLRLKRASQKTLLVPEIVSYYYARTDLKSFLRHNWTNGVWAILPFLYSTVMPVSWRHLVPLTFVVSLLTSAALSLISSGAMWLLAAIGGSYGTLNLLASAHVAWRERDVCYLLLMPFIFASLHVAYGIGSLWGLVKAVAYLLGSGRVRTGQVGKAC